MSRIATLLGSLTFAAMSLACGAVAAATHASPLAQTTGRAHVEVVDAGLRLSLSLPQQHYPTGAIVQAAMQVTNLSARAIPLGRTSFYDCRGTFAPQAVVMSRGTQVVPPIVAGTAFPDCPPPAEEVSMLPPHATLSSREYLLLRGPQVRAFVTIADSRSPTESQAASPLVGTPTLTVKLTASDAPSVTVRGGNVPIGSTSGSRSSTPPTPKGCFT